MQHGLESSLVNIFVHKYLALFLHMTALEYWLQLCPIFYLYYNLFMGGYCKSGAAT